MAAEMPRLNHFFHAGCSTSVEFLLDVQGIKKQSSHIAVRTIGTAGIPLLKFCDINQQDLTALSVIYQEIIFLVSSPVCMFLGGIYLHAPRPKM